MSERLRSERKRRILKLQSLLKQFVGEKVDKAIAEFCYEEGVRRERALEYLTILTRTDRVKVENGIIKEVK